VASDVSHQVTVPETEAGSVFVEAGVPLPLLEQAVAASATKTAADAATTSWALGRGASERNPLLTQGRFDVLMVKMVQLPLLLGAIETVEAHDPRLGRRLRWASVAFHALLAVNNLRGGHAPFRATVVPAAVRP